jgi:hypothetical protein
VLLWVSGIGGGLVQLIYLLLGTLQVNVLSNLISLFVWSSLVGFFRRVKPVYVQIAIGVCTVLSCVYAVLTATVFQEITWAPYKATQQVQGKFDTFVPQDPKADFVGRLYGIQGAGKIKVTLRAKSDRPQMINLTLIQFGSEIRFDKPCQLQITEVVCEISGAFSKRLLVGGAFGGFRKSEWKQGDSRILVSRFDMQYLLLPPLRSYLQNIPRVRSLYFNENAFGAVSALLALMCWFMFNRYLGLFMVVVNLVSIVLSGSQNALVAFLVAFLATSLVVLTFRRGKWANALAMVFVVTFVLIGPNLLQSFRIFNVNPSERNLERVAIWTQYIRSSINSSVIFGRGALDVPELGSTINARHGHNLWVQSFYQGGLLGLAGMLVLWFLAFWKGLVQMEPARVSILVCILMLNLFDYTFYFWPVQLIFWFSLIAWKPRA